MAVNAVRNIKAYFPAKCHLCGGAIAKGDRCWVNRAAVRGQRISCLACLEPGFVPMPGRGAPAPVPVPKKPAGFGMVPEVNPAANVLPMAGQAPVPVAVGGDGLAAAIASAVQGHLKLATPVAAVDEAAVRRIVDQQAAENAGCVEERIKAVVEAAIDKARVRRVEIVVPDMPKVDASGQHGEFPMLVQLLAARSHVWLVGPAGSGKTTAVENAATALGLRFFCLSVGEQTSVYQLLGHRAPDGSYVRSMFRDAYEHGGVFLLDEIDAGNANVLTTINSALSNGSCAFPDGMVKRHPDFLCAAAGNTYGRGANRVYVGRAQIDGATLDRFVFLEWGYDEALEDRLGAGHADWVEYVRACRAVVDRLAIRHVISPRAIILGARLLSAKVSRNDVEVLVLWKGLDADAVKRIKDGVRS